MRSGCGIGIWWDESCYRVDKSMEVFVISILFGIVTAVVADNRGASGLLWFCLGMLLGPIGLVLAFTCGRRCPDCASRINLRAKVCPRCRASLHPIKKPPQAELDEETLLREAKENLSRLKFGFKQISVAVVPLSGLAFLIKGLAADSELYTIIGTLLVGGCAVVIIRAILLEVIEWKLRSVLKGFVVLVVVLLLCAGLLKWLPAELTGMVVEFVATEYSSCSYLALSSERGLRYFRPTNLTSVPRLRTD